MNLLVSGGKIILSAGACVTVGAFPNLISRSLPVFASTGTSSSVISSNYNTIWSSTGTSETVALDISSVPSGQKTTNALYWYDETGVDTTTLYFDVGRPTGGGGVKNNQPATYTIEGNTGAGGGSAPGSGWVTLVSTVTNGYASRKHTLSSATSLAGYNWVRLNIATSSSSVISLKIDLWDVSGGNRDILHLGDSRVWFGLNHANPHGGSSACDSLGNLMQPSCGFYAPTLNTGMSGAKAADIDSLVAQWLTDMPGFKWATLNIGINDALASAWASSWTTSYQSIVNKLIAAGVKVFCESIGDTSSAGPHANLPAYNSAIAGVVSGTAGAFTGYDEYTFFVNNPSFLSGDQVHATDSGFAALRTAKATYYASLI
jgi:hypothetical protein